MTSLERIDEHTSPVEFNENIFSQSIQGTLSPLKMHALHVKERANLESGDITLTPSPSPTPNATPISQSSRDELQPLHRTPARSVSGEQESVNKMQQASPAIPPKSPLRGAKKSNWLSRLLSRTVGKLSCFNGESHKKTTSKKNTEQYKHNEAGARSTSYRGSSVGGGYANPGPTNHVITIPFVGGSPYYGGHPIDHGGNSADCGAGDCGGNCDC